jgi:hypothetical protein
MRLRKDIFWLIATTCCCTQKYFSIDHVNRRHPNVPSFKNFEAVYQMMECHALDEIRPVVHPIRGRVRLGEGAASTITGPVGNTSTAPGATGT